MPGAPEGRHAWSSTLLVTTARVEHPQCSLRQLESPWWPHAGTGTGRGHIL